MQVMTFLQKVVEEKKTLVNEKKENTSFEKLLKKAGKQKKRPFYEVFRERKPKDVKIIAEVKRASPSRGILRGNLNVPELAMKYEEGGASAISVITEANHFNGSLGFIPRVKNATCLSVLRKDFIVDAWELYESKAYGADAVLLIGEVLERDKIEEFLGIARTIDLDVLLEVHSMKAFEKVSNMEGFLLGINNRNLETLTVNLSTATTILSDMPDDFPVIIESGIKERKNITAFSARGVSGFLVGTSLVLSRDPIKKLRELREHS
jgi:indole-3-glycerol phosphate synthase